MKRNILALAGVLFLFCPVALAGDIRGKITASAFREAGFTAPASSLSPVPPPLDVVVWVEGAEAAASQAMAPAAPILTVQNRQITPSLAVAVAGQTVAIPNLDRMVHSLFSYSEAKRFDLGVFSKGETRSIVFDRPGVVDIYCSIHPSMHARVVVVPSPFFARTSLNGEYEIRNVPPGRYTLVAWNDRFHSQPKEVFVSGTGEVRADFTLLQ